MSQKFAINLTIKLPRGGSDSLDVASLYQARILDDIDETAWNLCDCSDDELSQRFSDLQLQCYDVKRKQTVDIKSTFTVNAENPEFINQVVDDFMSGFADRIRMTALGLYSRTGRRIVSNIVTCDWDVNIAPSQ